MAFQRPTLVDLAYRIRNDFVSRLTLVGAVLRRSVVNVLSLVIAGAVHMLHGHIEFLSLQLFPDRSESAYLVRQAAIFGVPRKAAAFAHGPLALVGVNGSVVPIHSKLRRADGAEYQTDAEVTISGGVANPTATALVAGAVGNAVAGVVLNFETPIAGVNSAATVDVGGLIDGSEEETDELLRGRLLARMANPPSGGAAADWVAKALEVPGVTRAWCTPLVSGAGTVGIYFVRDNDLSLIPDPGEVATLQAYLDDWRPVTALGIVFTLVEDPVAFTIHLEPDNSDTRAAATAALDDMFRRDAAPGATILLSHMRDAVGTAGGVDDYTMTVPAANSAHSGGHIPTRGVITFT